MEIISEGNRSIVLFGYFDLQYFFWVDFWSVTYARWLSYPCIVGGKLLPLSLLRIIFCAAVVGEASVDTPMVLED